MAINQFVCYIRVVLSSDQYQVFLPALSQYTAARFTDTALDYWW